MNEWLPKSWLFEVFNVSTQSVIESFTLILPPQSITIKEKQRVSIIKTFDSSFVDDYGPDNLEISIRGISGTARAFPTYRAQKDYSNARSLISSIASSNTKTAEGLTQQDAFLMFRNNIIRYKWNVDFGNLRLRVFNLYDEEAYECVLLDFSLDRTSSEPWRYPFTISLFVLQDLLNPKTVTTKSVFSKVALSTWITAADSLQANQSWIEDALLASSIVKTAFVRVNESILAVKNQITLYGNAVIALVEIPIATVQSMIDSFTQINQTAATLFKQGLVTISKYTNITSYMQSQIDLNMRLWAAIVQSNQAGTTTLNGPSLATVPSKSLTSTLSLDPEEDAVPSVTPGEDTQTLTFEGYKSYTIMGNDSLQSIALAQLGDSALWTFIADINSIGSNTELVPGETLQLPIFTASQKTNENIIQRDATVSPLGVDLSLDASGNIEVTAGDLATVGGVDNVVQSINMKLSSPLGSLIKHTEYGLLSQVGDAGVEIARSYMRMAVQTALLQDPRIKSIDSLDIKTTGGDKTEIKVSVTLLNVDEVATASVQL